MHQAGVRAMTPLHASSSLILTSMFWLAQEMLQNSVVRIINKVSCLGVFEEG